MQPVSLATPAQLQNGEGGDDPPSTIDVELPEVIADNGVLVAKRCSVTMQLAADSRDCVAVRLDVDALQYVAATCKHHGVSEGGLTHTKKDINDRPKGAVWVQQRQGFLFRAGGKSTFFGARSEYLPKGKGKGRKGTLEKKADDRGMGEAIALEKLKNFADSLGG